MSNGCAPVLASYSAIISFTSCILAVAGSYSRSVVSPWDENVRILAFMVGLLLTFFFRSLRERSLRVGIRAGYIAPFPKVVKMTFLQFSCSALMKSDCLRVGEP